MMKIRFLLVLMISSVFIMSGQESMPNQKELLRHYIGTWYSADTITDTEVGTNPSIKMTVEPSLNAENALHVKVFERAGNTWKTILVELISYDKTSNQIVALGTNSNHESFVGTGRFLNDSLWVMKDKDFNGQPILDVKFEFKSPSEVLLTGTDYKTNKTWKVKYIKQNPKDKNIGIQLVSVRKKMLDNPEKTLNELSRMGFSFIESFVYDMGKFYEYTPIEFKNLVESQGLKFMGSMVFKDMLDKDDKEIMTWWNQCVKSHKEAGVTFITTSNNEIDKVKTLKDLDRLCELYNTIGKLCHENGIKFGIHNHTKEFKTVETTVMYDYLLNNTNPEYVFFESDLYWMKVAGINPVDYFNTYPNRFLSWHLKDDTELGTSGTMDFHKIYSHAHKAGLLYPIAEVEQYNFDPLFSAEMAYQYLYYLILGEN